MVNMDNFGLHREQKKFFSFLNLVILFSVGGVPRLREAKGLDWIFGEFAGRQNRHHSSRHRGLLHLASGTKL
jgi:hypothetical protein